MFWVFLHSVTRSKLSKCQVRSCQFGQKWWGRSNGGGGWCIWPIGLYRHRCAPNTGDHSTITISGETVHSSCQGFSPLPNTCFPDTQTSPAVTAMLAPLRKIIAITCHQELRTALEVDQELQEVTSCLPSLSELKSPLLVSKWLPGESLICSPSVWFLM